MLVKSRGDSISLWHSGAASLDAAQADPDASLGGLRSSTRVALLGYLLSGSLPGLRLDFAGGENGVGTGSLEAVGDDQVRWTPPGGEPGAAVAIANGEQKLLEGSDPSKFVLVTRTSADDLAGRYAASLVPVFNSAIAQANQGPSKPTQSVRPRARTRVSVKQTWAAEWEVVSYLEAVACSDAAGPGMPWATFRWAAGEIKWEDETAFATRDPIDLKDWFVRIEVLATSADTEPSTLWVGRICDEALAAQGTDDGPMGDQDLAAFGLAHELDRNAITDSVCTEDGSTGFRVDAAIVFNGPERRGAEEFGNRSQSAVDLDVNGATRTVYAFDDARQGGDGGDPYEWTAHNVIAYLLDAHGPANIRFRLGGQIEAIQSLVVPPTPVYGRTVFEVLNDVLDRRRGLGWRIAIDGGGGIEVQVYTLTGEAMTSLGATLPAASEQADLALEDYRREIAENRLSFDSMSRYGRIKVVGEPVLVCFTVDGPEALTIGWTGAEENSYRNGAGSAGTDDAAKDANDLARTTNEALAHVFTRFLISRNWNWMAGAAAAGDGGKKNANGQVDITGGFDMGAGTPPPVRKWGRRVERWLPLRKPTGTAGSEPEYREPMVLVKDDRKGAPEPHKWILVDRTGTGLHKADVRPLDRDFGIEIRFDPAHVLAKERWSGANSTNKEPVWKTANLVATLAARTDERLTVTVNVDGGSLLDRTKLIEVPGAELWWVVEGTVTGVNANGVLEQTAGEILRNDVARLRQVAALAQAWYGKPRASLRVTFKEMRREFAVGLFVRQVQDDSGFEPVNSTVTRVTWDLAAMTTTIETQHGELDFAAAAGRLT